MTVGRAPADERALDALLSTPSPGVLSALRQHPGDVVVLGAGGKMGPTIVRLLVRAAAEPDAGAPRRIVAVSRFSHAAARAQVEDAGAVAIAADLLDRDALARLPDAPNVIFLAGQKFGTRYTPAATWAMNTVVPVHVAERYRASRIVALSTGNVYPLTDVEDGGSREDDAPAPIGEYAMSCLGRERVFEHAADQWGTRVALLRLNYAHDLRYGVLTDLAVRIWRGEPVDVRMGAVNVIWQGDAARIAVRALSLAAAPAAVLNVTGLETLRVRDLADRLGALLGRDPIFEGTEAPDALLSNAQRMARLLGEPLMPTDELLAMVADWVRAERPLLGKPTRFQERAGNF